MSLVEKLRLIKAINAQREEAKEVVYRRELACLAQRARDWVQEKVIPLDDLEKQLGVYDAFAILEEDRTKNKKDFDWTSGLWLTRSKRVEMAKFEKDQNCKFIEMGRPKGSIDDPLYNSPLSEFVLTDKVSFDLLEKAKNSFKGVSEARLVFAANYDCFYDHYSSEASWLDSFNYTEVHIRAGEVIILSASAKRSLQGVNLNKDRFEDELVKAFFNPTRIKAHDPRTKRTLGLRQT